MPLCHAINTSLRNCMVRLAICMNNNYIVDCQAVGWSTGRRSWLGIMTYHCNLQSLTLSRLSLLRCVTQTYPYRVLQFESWIFGLYTICRTCESRDILSVFMHHTGTSAVFICLLRLSWRLEKRQFHPMIYQRLTTWYWWAFTDTTWVFMWS